MDAKVNAETLVREGDRLLTARRGWLSKALGMSDQTSKIEDACDKYKAAVPEFRRAGLYREAGQTYEKAAYAQRMIGDLASEATYNKEAFKQYSEQFGHTFNANGIRDARLVEDAKRTLQMAAEHWYNTGDLTRAAGARKDLAEWLKEDQVKDYKGAEEEFKKAADLYATERKPALQTKYMASQAEMLVNMGDLGGALKVYSDLAKVAKKDDNMRYSVKNYVLSICVCALVFIDVPTANNALEDAGSLDPDNFGRGETEDRDRLYRKFVNDLINNLEDPDGFRKVRQNMSYASVLRTPLHNRILDQVEANIGERPSEFA